MKKLSLMLLATAMVLVFSVATVFALEPADDVEMVSEVQIDDVEDNEEQVDDVSSSEDQIDNTDIQARGIYEYKVIGNGVNVRKGAGLSYESYGHMNWGDICYSTSTADKTVDGITWKYVRCGYPLTGTLGWISSEYLQLTGN